ncbi:MAG: hypothetical protein IPN34_14545 [Planctomycetes bacterium]|nr:hypothetical protein [Planctomycetota bacterium]
MKTSSWSTVWWPNDVVPPGFEPEPARPIPPRYVPQEWTFDVTEEDQPPIVLAWRS